MPGHNAVRVQGQVLTVFVHTNALRLVHIVTDMGKIVGIVGSALAGDADGLGICRNIYYTAEALNKVAEDIDFFANKEGLLAHGKSVTIRKED